jgi:hypothetical protein
MPGCVAFIRDNGLGCKTLIRGSLTMQNLGCLDVLAHAKAVGGTDHNYMICGSLVGGFETVFGVSGHSWKRLWFLLLYVAVAVGANSSGRRIMFAGIKLVHLFTHSFLL